MQSFIHADVFFFVSTIVFALIGIVVIVAVIYTVSILRDVKYISKRIKEESDEVIEDLHELRLQIRDQTFKLAALNFIRKFFRRGKK